MAAIPISQLVPNTVYMDTVEMREDTILLEFVKSDKETLYFKDYKDSNKNADSFYTVSRSGFIEFPNIEDLVFMGRI